MDFGQALKAVKDGKAVTRAGWNGQGMWLHLVPGSAFQVEADRPIGKVAPHLVGSMVAYRGHIDMKTVDGQFVPWVASQTDLLAEDWSVVDG